MESNRERKVFRIAKQRKHKSLLELGAGAGNDSKYFYDCGLRVTSTDLSDEMIKLCKEKGLDSKVMDFYDLGFHDEFFESAYAINSILHVPKDDINSVLKEINRVLKPGGVFYMGVYGGHNFEGIWDEDWCEPKRFFSFYTDEMIQKVVNRYFELVYFNSVPLELGKHFHFQSIILRKT